MSFSMRSRARSSGITLTTRDASTGVTAACVCME